MNVDTSSGAGARAGAYDEPNANSKERDFAMLSEYVQARYSSRILGRVAVVLVTVTVSSTGNCQEGTPRRETIVARLEHQEALMKSAIVDGEVVLSETREEEISRIADVVHARGDAPSEVKHYMVDEQAAERMSYTFRWWRSGIKERTEKLAFKSAPNAQPLNITAFDGEFVRSIRADRDQQVSGSLHSLSSSAWNTTDRLHPFALMYEYGSTPFSQIVREGTAFHAATIELDGDVCDEVTVEPPVHRGFRFRLVFRSDGRMRLWEVATPTYYSPTPGKPVVYRRCELFDYQPHVDSSGETIWFPHHAVIHRYVGEHPADGKLVEYGTYTFTTRTVQFNVPIPEERFVLEFPKNAQVWNAVAGPAWVVGEPDIQLVPENRRQRSWILWSNVILIATFCGYILWRVAWRRSRGGAPGDRLP